MSRARFFLTEELPVESPCELPLDADDAKHLARVLRVCPGEELDVVGPSGSAWRVRVTDVSRHAVTCERVEELAPAWYPRITLFQGVAKGEKMDAIVRQAVEVGVEKIAAVMTSRTVVRFDADKRSERGARWRRIADSAAKQSRRESVPEVTDPIDFDEALVLLEHYDAIIVLWEDHHGLLLSQAARRMLVEPNARVALVVGPEGGLSADEVARLVEKGAVAASLGPSVLRTETAAVASLAIVVACAYETGMSGDE